MGSVSQHMARPVRNFRGDLTASILDVRELKITPDHKRWRLDLAQTVKGRDFSYDIQV